MTHTLQFAPQVSVKSAQECAWYHTFQFPDGTLARASWDLRDCIDDYLGHVDLAGKSVLEIGPASGFLTVAMEQRGGKIVCIENSMEQAWDNVPRVDIDSEGWRRSRQLASPLLYKSWWYSQKLFGCSAKVVYCGVSGLRDIAKLIKFDVCLIGGVLQHIQYPFDLLWSASRIANTIIVTERWLPEVESEGEATIRFVPAPTNGYLDTWFYLSSTAVTNALTIFGFEQVASRRFTARFWDMKDEDITKDKFSEREHYNKVFVRRT
jgi:O-methyltransferase